MNSIELTDVEKYFSVNRQRIKVVDRVSLHLEQGKCLALLGPSGCGKSTIFAMIAGFFPPDAGTVSIKGSIGLCMQDDKLLPWLKIMDNICLPARIKGRYELEAAREKAASYLPVFGLEGFGQCYPAQLSGGMRQRAALLRTLLAGEDMMLLDEPFYRLDALTKEDLQQLLKQIMERFAPGVMLITHDIDEALLLADDICLLTPRPASVIKKLPVIRKGGKDLPPEEHARMKKEIRSLLSMQHPVKIDFSGKMP